MPPYLVIIFQLFLYMVYRIPVYLNKSVIISEVTRSSVKTNKGLTCVNCGIEGFSIMSTLLKVN